MKINYRKCHHGRELNSASTIQKEKEEEMFLAFALVKERIQRLKEKSFCCFWFYQEAN